MSAAGTKAPSPAPVDQAPEHTGSRGATLVQRLVVVRELGIFAALLLLVLVTVIANPRFLSGQNMRDLLLSASILTVLAAGQTIVIVTRNVDLSVGSVLGLSAYASGTLLANAPGTPVIVVILAGMVVGALCGVLNGAIVAIAKVPSLVVTLGTLYAFRGLDSLWASSSDRLQINAADLPASFKSLGGARLLGIPVLFLIAAAVVLLVGFYLRNYRSGRELYGIGSDPAAARLSGIPVGRRVLVAFAVNGALAGLAGVLYAARFQTLDATAGTGLELNVVAAAVVGGVAIFGGSGSVYGAALGALLLTTIGTSLPQLGLNPFWRDAAVGALILAAIVLDRTLSLRLARRLRGRNLRGS
ncbi:ABC transporter permease [Blastococcus saxobsidens]|uniref:Autoinducer 2 import system permease protein LsrC n=1 Tax=Blastococcus saxobsidens TaxID=138336 RepID=A0A4Q7Y611_9ACTN|nr:ABC transporter permease [Blastococcus saxobsidens]RZU32088.1 monosaccharide ABC transporter membrane protein (CUT2 family) [Blastococcus saxobsidens]